MQYNTRLESPLLTAMTKHAPAGSPSSTQKRKKEEKKAFSRHFQSREFPPLVMGKRKKNNHNNVIITTYAKKRMSTKCGCGSGRCLVAAPPGSLSCFFRWPNSRPYCAETKGHRLICIRPPRHMLYQQFRYWVQFKKRYNEIMWTNQWIK